MLLINGLGLKALGHWITVGGASVIVTAGSLCSSPPISIDGIKYQEFSISRGLCVITPRKDIKIQPKATKSVLKPYDTSKLEHANSLYKLYKDKCTIQDYKILNGYPSRTVYRCDYEDTHESVLTGLGLIQLDYLVKMYIIESRFFNGTGFYKNGKLIAITDGCYYIELRRDKR